MSATLSLPTRIDLSSPLVSPGADDVVGRWESRGLIRDLAAEVLDENLRFLARADILIRRAVGRGLARLMQEHALMDLSYASLGDYALQRTGYSARHAQELAWMEIELAKFPIFDAAFSAGRLSPSKVRLLLRHLRPEEEAEWIERAERLSVRRLEDALELHAPRGESDLGVAALGPDPEEDRPDGASRGRWIGFEATPTLARKWRIALEMARRILGADVSVAACFERFMVEFMTGEGAPVLAEIGAAAAAVEQPPLDDEKVRAEEAARHREAWREIQRVLEDETEHWQFLCWDIPPVELAMDLTIPDGADPWQIDARIVEWVRLEQRVAGYMMRLLRNVSDHRLFRDMQFTSFGHYVRERLGISKSTANALVALERRFFLFPKLAEAFYSGQVSQTQAQLIAKVATEETEAAWIERARTRTALQLKRDVERALAKPRMTYDERQEFRELPLGEQIDQMCAPNEDEEEGPAMNFHFFLPAELEPMWDQTVDICRALYGVPPPVDFCVEAAVDAFLSAWIHIAREEIKKHPNLDRDECRCGVPHCSRRAQLENHHIKFRSRGGDNSPGNLRYLCRDHHQHGVHENKIHLTGTAPDALVWELGVRPDGGAHMVVVDTRIVSEPEVATLPRKAMPVH